MAYALPPIDDRFFEDAPLVVPASVQLDAPPERVWEALGSDEMWSWVPAIDQLVWITPRPLSGTPIRRLRLAKLVTIEEEFYRWEPARRATFRVTQQSRKVLGGLAEDFLLEPSLGGTRLTWTMAMDPGLPGAGLLAPLLKPGAAAVNKQGLAGIRSIL